MLLPALLLSAFVHTLTVVRLLFVCTCQPKPLPAGQKRKKESWENVWYVGMYGTMGLAAVLLYYKPDTR